MFAAISACTQPVDGPRVAIHTGGSEPVVVRVEVADTFEKRQMGLMHRRDLEPDQGMLFLFEEEAEHSFWMKNTPTSLDILFFSSGGELVGYVPETVPYSLRSVTIGRPSRTVLEVPAGFCSRHGVEKGDRITYHDVSSPLLP